jgi:hypothetical protein
MKKIAQGMPTDRRCEQQPDEYVQPNALEVTRHLTPAPHLYSEKRLKEFPSPNLVAD